MNRRLVALLLIGLAAAGLGAWTMLRRAEVDSATDGAIDRFFANHVTTEGQVLRSEGDTVSEGQAYALLMAVAADRPQRFADVWEWTRRNLLRSDGAMAWLWDGKVIDDGIAPDADVDAAVALYLAAEHFDRPSYGEAAGRMARAVLDSATARAGGRLHLTAGEWALGPDPVLNPSYLDPASFSFLAERTGDDRWRALERAARRVLRALTRGRLPPDWAVVESHGIRPISSPDEREEPGRFGFDALRVPLRLATECTASLARGMGPVWPVVAADPGAAIRRLNGERDADWDHAAAFVSAAALAHTAQPDRVESLLERAAEQERAHPDYYGAAWVALGRVMLTSSTLERCA